MANSVRGEVDFSFTDVDDEQRIYTLKFNNQAKVAVEQQLKMTRAEILQAFATGNGEADEIRFALLFQGTRRHHSKDLKTPNAIFQLLDDFDDARSEAKDGGIALSQEFMASIMAAYTRQDKDELLEMLRGDVEPEGDAGDDSSATGKGKAEDTHRTEAGSGS